MDTSNFDKLSECFPSANTHLGLIIDYQILRRLINEQYGVQGKNVNRIVSDDPMRKSAIERFTENAFYELIKNYILFDLFRDYKQKKLQFKDEFDLLNEMAFIYQRYCRFIMGTIYQFEKNIKKYERQMRKDRIKITKVKRIPRTSEPIEMSLGIRFAVIKMANGKCECCGSIASEKSIDAYQIRDINDPNTMQFIAYCEECKMKNNHNIVSIENE
jgi:hypothetical protein